MFITTASDLAAFCTNARGESAIYLDTEFIGEESYHPRLEIIQVAAAGKIAIVDYPAIPDLSPLWAILADSAVEKVFHAGQQDLALLSRAAGSSLCNTFDTQIAAAFVGWGEQVSYSDLVNAACGVRLSKSHTYSTWGRRPLSAAQLAYAEDDVRYLPEITRRLKDDLARLGRLEWAREEFEAQEQAAVSGPVPVEDVYERVKGAMSLRPRDLAILRELAAWREDEAKRRDRPRQSILRDPVLVSLARHAPRSVNALREILSFPGHVIERYGRDLVDAVARGLAVPKDQLPRKRERREANGDRPLVVSLLQTLVRLRASEREIAQGILARSNDLEDLADLGPKASEGDLRILQGWRWEMVGRDLVRLLRGEITLAMDAASGRPAAVERTGA